MSNPERFAAGMVVYLKTGSPPMTVDSRLPQGDIKALWFDKDWHLQEGAFAPDAIFVETPELKYLRAQYANNIRLFLNHDGNPEVVRSDAA